MKVGQQRQFYLIIGFGAMGFGLWKEAHGRAFGGGLIGFGAGMMVVEFFLPWIAKPIFDLWMKVGQGLGRVNTAILLSLVYFGVMLPISCIRRIFKKTERTEPGRRTDSSWVKLPSASGLDYYTRPY